MNNILPALIFLVFLTSRAQVPVFKATIFDSTLTGYFFLRNNYNPAILDSKGNVVYYFKPASQMSVNGYFGLIPGGKMVYCGHQKYFITDSTFKVIDSVSCKNYETDAHEFIALPNGHFLLLGADTVRMDVSRYCFFRGRCGSKNAIVRWTVIQEQDAHKKVVWEWRAKDHFSVEDADTFYLDDPNYLDVNHANALEVDRDGNILLSSRNMNEITKINRRTGKIMWRFGGNANQFEILDCPVPFYAQHDIRRIANGHITLFDNGENNISHGTRALEFELDETKRIARLVWSYTFDTTYSGGYGNVQRLNNSNTLVCFGKIGSNKTCFAVVDSTGSKIFQLDGSPSYRVLYYPSLPWQLHRPVISCFDSVGVIYLDAGSGYASYTWSNGDSTRIIRAMDKGTYSVFVPYGDGGFISSEKVAVDEHLYPCLRVAKFREGK